MLGYDRITFDTNIIRGRACIHQKRVTVSLVINLVANGMSTEEIIEAYPYLEPEDVRQALQYAAWLAEDPCIHWNRQHEIPRRHGIFSKKIVC